MKNQERRILQMLVIKSQIQSILGRHGFQLSPVMTPLISPGEEEHIFILVITSY